MALVTTLLAVCTVVVIILATTTIRYSNSRNVNVKNSVFYSSKAQCSESEEVLSRSCSAMQCILSCIHCMSCWCQSLKRMCGMSDAFTDYAKVTRPRQDILLPALTHLGCTCCTQLQINVYRYTGVMRPAFQSNAGLPLPYLHARGGLLCCRLPLLCCI